MESETEHKADTPLALQNGQDAEKACSNEGPTSKLKTSLGGHSPQGSPKKLAMKSSFPSPEPLLKTSAKSLQGHSKKPSDGLSDTPLEDPGPLKLSEKFSLGPEGPLENSEEQHSSEGPSEPPSPGLSKDSSGPSDLKVERSSTPEPEGLSAKLPRKLSPGLEESLSESETSEEPSDSEEPPEGNSSLWASPGPSKGFPGFPMMQGSPFAMMNPEMQMQMAAAFRMRCLECLHRTFTEPGFADMANNVAATNLAKAGSSSHIVDLCTVCGKSLGSHLNQLAAQNQLAQSRLAQNQGQVAFPMMNSPNTPPGAKNNMKFHCSECPKWYKSNGELKKHMLIHTGERPYTCEVCSKTFRTNSALHRHVRIHGSDKQLQCFYCDKRFDFTSEREKHMRVHTGDRPYKCPQCQAAFSLSCNLRRHVMTHNATATFQCSECQKWFTSKRSLTRHHKLIHSGDTSYKCPLCDDGFPCSEYLKKHMRKHARAAAGPKKRKKPQQKIKIDPIMEEKLKLKTIDQKCPHCNMWFVYEASLKNHLKKEHNVEWTLSISNDNDIKDDIKGGSTSSTNNTSADPGEFKCYVCHLLFNSQEEVIDHVGVHDVKDNIARGAHAVGDTVFPEMQAIIKVEPPENEMDPMANHSKGLNSTVMDTDSDTDRSDTTDAETENEDNTQNAKESKQTDDHETDENDDL